MLRPSHCLVLLAFLSALSAAPFAQSLTICNDDQSIRYPARWHEDASLATADASAASISGACIDCTAGGTYNTYAFDRRSSPLDEELGTPAAAPAPVPDVPSPAPPSPAPPSVPSSAPSPPTPEKSSASAPTPSSSASAGNSDNTEARLTALTANILAAHGFKAAAPAPAAAPASSAPANPAPTPATDSASKDVPAPAPTAASAPAPAPAPSPALASAVAPAAAPAPSSPAPNAATEKLLASVANQLKAIAASSRAAHTAAAAPAAAPAVSSPAAAPASAPLVAAKVVVQAPVAPSPAPAPVPPVAPAPVLAPPPQVLEDLSDEDADEAQAHSATAEPAPQAVETPAVLASSFAGVGTQATMESTLPLSKGTVDLFGTLSASQAATVNSAVAPAGGPTTSVATTLPVLGDGTMSSFSSAGLLGSNSLLASTPSAAGEGYVPSSSDDMPLSNGLLSNGLSNGLLSNGILPSDLDSDGLSSSAAGTAASTSPTPLSASSPQSITPLINPRPLSGGTLQTGSSTTTDAPDTPALNPVTPSTTRATNAQKGAALKPVAIAFISIAAIAACAAFIGLLACVRGRQRRAREHALYGDTGAGYGAAQRGGGWHSNGTGNGSEEPPRTPETPVWGNGRHDPEMGEVGAGSVTADMYHEEFYSAAASVRSAGYARSGTASRMGSGRASPENPFSPVESHENEHGAGGGAEVRGLGRVCVGHCTPEVSPFSPVESNAGEVHRRSDESLGNFPLPPRPISPVPSEGASLKPTPSVRWLSRKVHSPAPHGQASGAPQTCSRACTPTPSLESHHSSR